jgi:ABC-type lipoprotein release transport system permease subunit
VPREGSAVNVATLRASAAHRSGLGLSGALAWRNLWRNRLRTALTVGGIAFAVTLTVAAYSLQGGAMDAMSDQATQLLTGHLQIQHRSYAEDPSLRHLVPDATAVARALKGVPGVTAVAQRAIGFALVSVGERSYGAQVIGVDPQQEPMVSSLANLVVKGRCIARPDDALLGSVIARNLGVDVGDEFVLLGSKLDGSVAALSLHVSGIVESGAAELDRALVQVQLAAFQDEFGLGDQVHMVVARVSDLEHVDATVPAVAAALAPLGTATVVLPWQRLLPEVAQTMQLKRAGSLLMLALIAVLVTFSIFNSFMMTVFERTREFGMLLAIGMRPAGIIGVLQIEAAWLALLGAGIGLVVGGAAMAATQHFGIPLGEMAGELARRFNLPDRIYPALNVGAMLAAPFLMLLATQVAALIPALRIRTLAPVEGLRVGA